MASKSFTKYLKDLLDLEAPPVILPYRGYGTQRKVWLKGHLLDDRLLYEATEADSKRRNMKALLSRYLADPLEGWNVEIEFFGKKEIITTRHDGFFETSFDFENDIAQQGWLEANYTVLEKTGKGAEALVSKAGVYVLDEKTEYGVISDVDDTILVSHAAELLKKMRLVLTKNARTRLPFPGIAGFYHALQDGLNLQHKNPIFYVSSSEWNLYDFLVDFCEFRGIPRGPFLLKDYRKSIAQVWRSGGGSHLHKLHKIKHLLTAFPSLPFILLGDSGQHDAEIYAQAVHEFPGRILAIYIRDVSRAKKDVKVRKISDALRAQKVELLLVANTLQAAEHAFEKGFITQIGLEKVRSDFDNENAPFSKVSFA